MPEPAAKILVADDDQSLVRTLTWILKENGYEVVTDSLKPDEIYHILVRRVARVLQISKCSMVLAKPGDQLGVVVAAYENPMLRNLQIELVRYPEIQRALTTSRSVLVEDVTTDPLYQEERVRWQREQITVPTRSAVALPFSMKDQQLGVFFLRTTGEDPPLTRADAQFSETVIRTAVAAIEKAYDFETAVSDKKRLEKLAATDALTGCLNRRALSEELAAELDRARRYNLALTILLADIDRFKLVNDTRGHIAGDSVLRQVGEILRREARSVDLVAPFAGRHRGPYAPAGEAGARSRLLPPGGGARLALPGSEKAGRRGHVVRLPRPRGVDRARRGDQGALPKARHRPELRGAAATRGRARHATRPPGCLSHPPPRRIRGWADLSGHAVPEGRAALGPRGEGWADGARRRDRRAASGVRRAAPRARAPDRAPRPEARRKIGRAHV